VPTVDCCFLNPPVDCWFYYAVGSLSCCKCYHHFLVDFKISFYLLLCHRHRSLCCFPHAAVVASDPRLIVASTPTVVLAVATCCHCHNCHRLNFTFLYCLLRCWHRHRSRAVVKATACPLSHCLSAIFLFSMGANGGLRKTAN